MVESFCPNIIYIVKRWLKRNGPAYNIEIRLVSMGLVKRII